MNLKAYKSCIELKLISTYIVMSVQRVVLNFGRLIFGGPSDKLFKIEWLANLTDSFPLTHVLCKSPEKISGSGTGR